MALTTEERKELHEYINGAHSIAWDTCHKIYILMDEKQTQDVEGYGYKAIIKAEYSTPSIMYSTVLNWYKKSCGLEMVDACTTNGEDTDWYTIVSQR